MGKSCRVQSFQAPWMLQAVQSAVVNPGFARWFGESKVVDDCGLPLLVFHGTAADDFKSFRYTEDVGFHFGTIEAAEDRLELEMESGAPGRIIPAFLKIERPLEMPDLHTWASNVVLGELVHLGVITQRQEENADGFIDAALFRRFLHAKGYDGVAYANESEGMKGQYSWIALQPQQVKGLFARAFNTKSKDFLNG